MALGFQRNQQLHFRQKNNRLRLGTAIWLLGFVCWTSCLLVGVIVAPRRSAREGDQPECIFEKKSTRHFTFTEHPLE
jgi:hypothetical protein